MVRARLMEGDVECAHALVSWILREWDDCTVDREVWSLVFHDPTQSSLQERDRREGVLVLER